MLTLRTPHRVSVRAGEINTGEIGDSARCGPLPGEVTDLISPRARPDQTRRINYTLLQYTFLSVAGQHHMKANCLCVVRIFLHRC